MSFSLHGVDADGGERDEFLSLSNVAMAALRNVLAPMADGGHSTLLARLSLNDGALVEPAECRWVAAQFRAVDRAVIARDSADPDELLGLVDQFVVFCDRCAGLGGFEVW